MEALPVYYVRSEQEALLATHKSSRGRHPSAPFVNRQILLAVAGCMTLFLVVLAVVENEPFVPTLAAFLSERWLSVSAAFKPRTDHNLTSIFEPSWEGLKGGEHCLRYATRQYTARLSDRLVGQDMIKVCKETPVEIHGDLLYTDFCQDLGFNRGVWGYWIVDYNEPDCETRWGEFTDLGCLDGIAPARRIEARLENLRKGDDWQFMCVTTPADIDGRYYSTPAECFNQGRWGVYGSWYLHDNSCSSQHNGAGQPAIPALIQRT